jgi:hypothetical protein
MADDPLKGAVDKATGGAPKSPREPYTYYSPEAKRARHEGLVDLVRRRNDAEYRLKDIYDERRQSAGTPNIPNYAKGGTVKKGSSTVPSFCKGGKVIKSWGR